MPRFLHAMCGTVAKNQTTKEFATLAWEETRLDTRAEATPHTLGSLRTLNTFPDNAFDAIYTSRSLEHLYPHEVLVALQHCLRILDNNGYIVLVTADLQAACELVAEDKLLEPAYNSPAGPIAPIDILYGFRPALASGKEYLACHCGFTAKALVGTLAQAGFASVWSVRNPRTFTVAAIATKVEQAETFLKKLATDHFG